MRLVCTVLLGTLISFSISSCGIEELPSPSFVEGKADSAATEDRDRSCEGLSGALASAPKKTLPTLARSLLAAGCDTAGPCQTLLDIVNAGGDSPEVSDAIGLLGCLQPVGADYLAPPPTIAAPHCTDSFAAGCGGGSEPVVHYATISSNGLFYVSADGSVWTTVAAVPGYELPTATWTAVALLQAGNLGQVIALAGSSTKGVYRTVDGGRHWFRTSGPGSGLEATSQNAAVFLTTRTSYQTTDVLVGMVGATNGGVYLSGDLGERWTQINSGFDPNSLSISTLVKTSCNGCPVQYYSGTYGSGMYTRTIAVTHPPEVTGWCFGSTSCTCGETPPSGPFAGGQPFKICGSYFQSFANVVFGSEAGRFGAGGCRYDRTDPAHPVQVCQPSCTVSSSSVIVCAKTPSAGPNFSYDAAGNYPARVLPSFVDGTYSVRVQNTDTRVGYLPQSYEYLVP